MRPMVTVRVSVAAVVAAAALGLAGCSSPAEEPPGLTASPTSTSSATSTADADAETEADVLDAYHRYWAATVAAQRGNPDPTLFADNTRGALVEEELATARQYAELGISREGEPVVSDVAVELAGDTADVWACVDNSAWVVPAAEGDPAGVLPTGLHLEWLDDAWYVTEYVTPPAGFTC